MGISEEDVKRMEARVAGAAARGAEPVRATLPAKFIILGHAVSVGSSYVPLAGRMVKTAERREWDKLMDRQLREQWNLRLPIEEEVYLIVDVYIAANTMDADNALKPAQDALQQAGILKNDRLVRRATITKHVDRHQPRVEVVIYPSTLKPL